MPDLVQRLRIHADSKHAGQQSIYTEAADLIEELEAKLGRVESATYSGKASFTDIELRALLEGEEE